MNLVSLAMQYLGPVIINRIASSLGIGQGVAGKLIAAALPTILAGLAGSASKPGGAGALGNVLSKVDPGILGNLGNLIGGGGQQQLVDSGTNALSGLLGGSSTNAIAGALAKFGGVDAAKGASLLGMLAPVALGTLAKQQKDSGLDAAGIASLLNSQKGNIAAAMPAGFSDLLKGSGVLDSIAGNLAQAAPAAHVAPPQSSGGGLPRWLLPLVLALAGLYLVSSYGCNRQATTTAPVEKPAASAPAEKAPAAAPAQDLTGLATKAIGALTTSLGTIKDEATATAAVPALKDVASQVDGLKAAAALLSGDARAPITAAISSALPGITAAIEKATGIPGVGAIITPVLQPVVANLTALSK